MFKRWLLKTFFKPVRSYKLNKSYIRADETPTAVLSHFSTYKYKDKLHKSMSFTVHYGSSAIDNFNFSDEQLFKSERDIIEGMIPNA